ncbi:hypothetical protein SAY87_009981 [Trapa incisa]|uniref:Inhibitor of growth protein N-terminal histone-binding domain-containing protein n=1 Tax=Trapa incisa TaxID=236973 RepID=A0AAN7GTE8_9MYRT|nr:hypothetical protein SAY87_009981 [Trapa incisa]
MMNQTQEQTKSYLGLSLESSIKGNKSAYGYRQGCEDDESNVEKIQKDIEANQDNALNLCTEKVLLARQALDLINIHIKRFGCRSEQLCRRPEGRYSNDCIGMEAPTIPLCQISRMI